MDRSTIEDLVDAMTLEEQVAILSGEDSWSLPAIARLGLGKLRVTDGPNGARGGGSLTGGVTAAAFPVGIAIGASWDPDLAREIGAALAREVRSKGAHVCLGPTVNLQRSVTNGRNFECHSEDPELAAQLAAALVAGLQSGGVAATVKHFAGNESEIERTTISSEIDERSLREVYLRPFEAAVRDGGAWAVMTAYNRLNGTYAAEHGWLLSRVLREEWGFDGAVMSDWFGSRTTAPTVNAGLDLEMPGPTRDRGAKLVAAVADGEVDRATIRARALAVLRLMERTGALQEDAPHEERAEDRPEDRALIRRAGAAGSVLLRNSDGILPLSRGTVAAIGPNAARARIMGGGSAQLNPHYAVTPLQALRDRLGDEAVPHAPGCDNHRWEPVIDGPVEMEYFDSPDLSGPVSATATLEESQYFFMGAPAPGIDPHRFSCRARARFVPEAEGVHSFGLHSTGFSRLFVNGRQVIECWESWRKGRTFFEEGNDEVTAEVDLRAGEPVEVVMEFGFRPGDNLDVSAFRFGVSRPLGDADIAAAVEAARRADTALVFVGRSGEWDTEGSDLDGIALPGRQDELVARVAEVNPRTVVVLQTGGPVEMPWIDAVPAVLQAWYPGQEAGNAIADMLFGDVEPGGRLAQTFPHRYADNPTHTDDPEIYPGRDGRVRYAEGVFGGYRHYDRAGIDPLFAFGHGLGYTRFALSELQVAPRGEGAEVALTVANAGDRPGSTVVQVYLGKRAAPVPAPERELAAFRKVALAPGESVRITLPLDPRAFAVWDRDAWRIGAGSYVVEAGFSARDLPLAEALQLGERVLER